MPRSCSLYFFAGRISATNPRPQLAGLEYLCPQIGELSKSQTKDYRTSIDMGGYSPKKFTNINDLPEVVRTAVQNQLILRLGTRFADKLEFLDGEIYEREVIYRVRPNAMNYQWEIPAYVVWYCLEVPSLNECFGIRIELRADGTALHGIDLPPLREHPERINLMKEEVVRSSPPMKKLQAVLPLKSCGFGYSADTESFLYCYTYDLMPDNGGWGTIMNIYFDAVTGERSGSQIIRYIH